MRGRPLRAPLRATAADRGRGGGQGPRSIITSVVVIVVVIMTITVMPYYIYIYMYTYTHACVQLAIMSYVWFADRGEGHAAEIYQQARDKFNPKP